MSALPIRCYGQKCAWMDKAIFSDRCNKHLVLYMQSKSLSLHAVLLLDIAPSHHSSFMLVSQAALLLDSAPSHPSSSTLVFADGEIKCLFLPRRVTSLVPESG